MTTNVFLRELDFGLMNEADGRRLDTSGTGRRDHERHTHTGSRSGGSSTSERGTVPGAGGSQG